MKKILMILDNAFKPDLRVKKEIETLNNLGISVNLYCWDKECELTEFEQKDLLKIRRIRVKTKSQLGIRQIKNLVKLFSLLIRTIKEEKQRFDYIYVHDFLMLPAGIYFKFKLNIPLIYDAHEIYHIMEWEKYNRLISNMIFLTERFLLNFVDHFIVVNQLRKNFYQKYHKKEIIILGNWYDPYVGEEIDIKKELNIRSGELVFGYFGALNVESRNLDFIIKSVLEIPNAHLLIAGNGADVNFVKDLSKKHKNIHFLGWIEEIRKYFNNLDYILYFINANQKYYNYAAPNTLYISLSHKIPLITNVPGEPELLIKQFNIGYFIKNGEKFCNKIELNPCSDNYKKMVENIHKIDYNYNWSISYSIYSNIFNLQQV